MIGGNCARRVIACKEVMRKDRRSNGFVSNNDVTNGSVTLRRLRSGSPNSFGTLFSEGLVPLSKDHSRQQNLCVQSESTPPKRKACTKRRRYILQPTPEFGSSDYFNSSLGGSSPNHFTYILVNSPLARALSMAVSMAFMSSGLFLLTGKPKDSLLRTSGRW